MSEPTEPLVESTRDGAVARITLNRPAKRNALSRALLDQFAEAVDAVRGDDSVRVLVLAANGPVFCAGMDLAEMEARASDPQASELWAEDTRLYRDLMANLFVLPMPTLAVVQGPALAGGLGLVLACDLVLAADDAFFSLPEPQRGITAAVVTPLLNYRVGAGASSYLLLSGQRVAVADALGQGLCHVVVPRQQLEAQERALVASILTGAPAALATTKAQLIACAGENLLDQLNAAMHVSAQARETAEAREGLAAFLERRKPKWQVDAS